MHWLVNRRKKAFRETIDEAERLLAGRSLDSPGSCCNPVAAWSIVGTLGHASRADFRGLAPTIGRPHRDLWWGVVAFLAGETLSATRDDETLVRIQRKVLIPLELSLLGGEVPSPTSPLGVVAMVRRALGSPLLPDT